MYLAVSLTFESNWPGCGFRDRVSRGGGRGGARPVETGPQGLLPPWVLSCNMMEEEDAEA